MYKCEFKDGVKFFMYAEEIFVKTRSQTTEELDKTGRLLETVKLVVKIWAR